MKRIVLLFICTVTSLLVAKAQIPSTANLVADGEVNASVYDAATQKLYVAGNFTAFGNPSSANFASLNAVGLNNANALPAINGQVNKIVADGANLFVVGIFHRVGSSLKIGIVKLNAQRQVDPSFNPALDFFDTVNYKSNYYEINDIAISGNLIAISGKFRINGTLRNVALLNKTTGAIYSWSPFISAGTDRIYDVEFSGSLLFVGGNFNLYSGVNNTGTLLRRAFAAFVVSNPAAVTLSSGFNFGLSTGSSVAPIVYSMSVTGSTLYIGGFFTGGSNFFAGNIFSVNISTGTRNSSFNAGLYSPTSGYMSSYVSSIVALSANQIFVGGQFYTPTVGGNTRYNFALLNSTGSFNTSAQFNIGDYSQTRISNISVVNTGTNTFRLFMSGPFTYLKNLSRIYKGMVAYDFNSVNLTFSQNTQITNGTAGPILTCIRDVSGNYYLGGSFSFAGGTRCPHLAVFNSSGNLDMTNTNSFFMNSYGNMSINSMAMIGSNLYLGGKFKSNNSSDPTGGRSDLMKISKSTLSRDVNFPQLFFQHTESFVNVLVADGANLYIGGKFSRYVTPAGSQVLKNHFFAWNTSTNTAINFTGNLSSSGTLRDIAFNSSHVFLGGEFLVPFQTGTNNNTGIAKFSKNSLNLENFLLVPSQRSSLVSSLRIIGSDLYVGTSGYPNNDTIFVYLSNTSAYKAKYSLPSTVGNGVRFIMPVSSTSFIASASVVNSGTKLFFSQIHTGSTFQSYSMNEDTRVSAGFRPLNYYSNFNLIFGTYWGPQGIVSKIGVSSGYGSRTFAGFNNNLVLPAPPVPGSSASAINLNPSTTQVNMSWTNGSGARRIVLARKDLDPIIPTTFPTSIFASSSFSNGTNLGSATFCVYDGMGSNVIISNLHHLSNYRFAVVEYNINGTIRTYRTTGVPFASCFTLDFAAPTTASTFLQVSNITSNSFNQSWINGSGSARMVLIKEGANSISFVPEQGINYFTNQTLSDGSRVASSFQLGNFFNFTGLNPGTTYSVAIIDYNTYSGVGRRYGSVIPKTNVTTSSFASLPLTQSSNINIIPGTTSANISWTRGSGGRSIAIVSIVPGSRPIGNTTINAINGTNYIGFADMALGSSPTSMLTYLNGFNHNVQVVYHGTGNSVLVSNLIPGSIYQVAVFESNGGGFGGPGQVVYLTAPRPTATFTTNSLVVAPSSITNLHSIVSSQDDARLNWSGGNATNSLVILKKDGPVNFAPTNDNFYTPNASFGLGAQLGVGNYAVYAGNSNSFVNIANLDPDAEYHFAVYDYNAQGLVAKYNPTPYRGIFRTSRAWPVRAGGPKKDAGGGVVTDASGNVYVAGTFETFGSWGTSSLPASGGNDIFLTKYSPNGKPLWVVKQGGGDADAASSLALDNSGNLIMTGSFRGTGTFGAGNTFGSNGIDDIFISKLTPSGNVIWSKRAGGTDQDVAFSIATDNNGDIYIAGYFRGTITFPGSTTTMTSLGGTDALIAKYDGNGNLLWAKSGGGTGNDFAYGVSVRGGNVAMVGQFDLTASFEASSLVSTGQSDIFIAEYSGSNGSLNWVNKFGGTGFDIGFSITTAGSDYVIAGQFANSVTIGSTTLNSAGNSDVLVVRVNSSGVPVWFKRAGGISQDAGRGIAINSVGDKLFVTGSFAESAVFGPTTLNSYGNLDIFVATVDLATGDFETTYQNGGPLDDEARGITAGTSNTSFITGYFNGQGSFGNVDLTSAGDWDIFVHKFTLVVAPDLNNGLVAWYKMNNNANDASGNGNNGFAQNITSTTDRSNSANKAYLFQPSISGVDVLGVDPVNVAGAATTNASTYLAWIKTAPNFENSNTPKPIFYTSFGDSEIRGIQLSDINTVTYAFNSNTTSLQVNQNSVAPIQDNSWHHLAVVFKSGIEIIFYLDGNEIGRQNITNFFEPETFLGTHWNIGHVTDINRNTQIYSFNGSIDDVRIYRRALSSAEVNFIKNQSATNSLVEESDKKLAKVSPEVKMWPNPTNGKLNLDLGVMASMLSLKIVDLSGVEVMNRTISNLNDSYVALDVQQLNVGYYFVQLNIDGQSSIQKLIISK